MVERFEDIYEFNIEGNFEGELQNLRQSIETARKEWGVFTGQIKRAGAVFRAPAKELKKMAEAGDEAALAAERQKPALVSLAKDSTLLAQAYNQLRQEQNALNVARQRELLVLSRTNKEARPRIIEARAEVAALRRLSAALQEKAEKSFFARKAAELGLQVSADGKRLFDAEAVAAERAAKAQEELAVRRALAARGLTDQGTEPLVQDGRLTEAGQAEAQRRADAALQNALLREQQLQLRNNNKEWLEAERRTKAAQKQFALLTGAGEKSEGTFNRVSFTFRRLIGIMAAFTIARQVVSGFNSMIATAIRFNAEIESSRVGLAGLIAAAAEVRGPAGEELSVDDQVLRSQDIAIDQMAKLRKQALETAASYDELATSFQTAVAPGISAGLGLDQIREITVLISQAATGLGVAQNQLAEEIRSLFQGTITPRNTRIAVALGISNQDIARAKELGILYEFLSGRFAAIGKTGKLLLNAFTGQLSNAGDALKQLLAVSSTPLFEQLKAGLKEVQVAIFDTSRAADDIFNENAINAFQGLFEGLANGVRGIRSAFQSVDAAAFGDAFAAVGQSLGAIISALANAGTFLVNAATPTVSIFANVLNLLTKISLAFKTMLGPLGGVVGSFLLMVARGLIFYRTILLVRAATSKLPTLWNQVTKAILGSAAAAKAAEAGAIGLRGALTTAWAAARRFLVPIALAAGALVGIDTILENFGIKFSALGFVGDIFGFLNDSLDRMLGGLAGVDEELTKIADQDLASVNNPFRELRGEIEEARAELQRLQESANRDISVSDILRGRDSSTIARQAAVVQEEINKAFDSEAAQTYRRDIKSLSGEIEGLNRKYQETAKQSKAFAADLNAAEFLDRGKVRQLNKELEETDAAIRRLQDADRLGEGTAASFLAGRRLQLERELNKIFKEDAVFQDRYLDSLQEENNLLGLIKSKEEDRAAIQKDFADLTFKAQLLALSRNKALSKDAIFASQIRLEAAEQELDSILASNQAFAEQNRFKEEVALRSFELAQIESEISQRALADARDIRDLNDQIAFASQQDTEEGRSALALLEEQLRLKNIELTLEEAINAERIRRAELELKLAKLRESGSTDQGIAQGLRGFASENASEFNTGEQFGRELGGALPRFVGDGLRATVAAAFDRTQNVDLADAIRDIGAGIALDLVTNLVTGLASNAISSLIDALGIGVLDAASTATETGAASSAASIKTTAAATSAATDVEAATTAAGIWVQSASTWGTAIIGAASKAAAQLTTTSTTTSVAGVAGGSATGGAVNRLKMVRHPNLNVTHANAPGFARGGRPAGIDPRDTIPAFLRPGEWVIRPEAVRLYGDRLFDLLNRGRLNPSALRGVAGSLGGARRAPRLKQGYATGGAVAAPARRSQALAGQVIQFHDEQTMERALAAGPNAPVRFARSRRGAYRAALGIDPGT